MPYYLMIAFFNLSRGQKINDTFVTPFEITLKIKRLDFKGKNRWII